MLCTFTPTEVSTTATAAAASAANTTASAAAEARRYINKPGESLYLGLDISHTYDSEGNPTRS